MSLLSHINKAAHRHVSHVELRAGLAELSLWQVLLALAAQLVGLRCRLGYFYLFYTGYIIVS